ncbi:hypothetical protein [Kitasatospora azatica]|uniref:hypothetical protein n=1 Tax=Kitasatospora azatica TaxID=58347 RepID=UPI000AABB754|nr:hypothetical protein [Kitasatospora azatica]
MSSSADRTVGHESAALDEIELTGELMIAATDSPADRLPTARIDEVLLSQSGSGADPAEPAAPDENDEDRISSAAAD